MSLSDLQEYLTHDFKAGEFLHSDAAERAGVKFPEVPPEIEANIRALAVKVQQARDIWGVKTTVNSGWRPTEPVDINKLAGSVSTTSAHIEGLAADLKPDGMELKDALKMLTDDPTFMEGVDQVIIERGCIHIGLPCKASGYKARREVRTESYTFNQRAQKAERHYPLLFVWKPKEA